jgi:phosphoribosyl 1,2-cyclic phosphate phosphodiesterase
MRFTFLGTGTSAGIPTIGCDCDVCTSTDERDKRFRTSGLIEWIDPAGHERAVLIDAGPDLRQQVLSAGLKRLDAILFTHNHVDHTFGLDEVRRFNIVMGKPIDVFANAHTLEHLGRVYQHIFEPGKNVQKSFVASLIAHEITGEHPIDLFGLRFTPIDLLHGRLPILGFRIEPVSSLSAPDWLPLAYCTDVSGIPTESWAKLTGLNTLVLDALRPRKHATHFTLDEAVTVAERVEANRTFFVHMSHELAHQETNESLPESINLAHDGLTLG